MTEQPFGVSFNYAFILCINGKAQESWMPLLSISNSDSLPSSSVICKNAPGFHQVVNTVYIASNMSAFYKTMNLNVISKY